MAHSRHRHVRFLHVRSEDVLLDLLVPRRCAACGRLGAALCPPCLARLPRLRGPCCARCGAPTAWPVKRCLECSGRRLAFASARAAVAYRAAVRPLVAAWKDRGLRQLAEEAADIIVETVERPGAGALTFVPPDGDRSVKRGHHPAERLAQALAARWELPVLAALARRGIPTVMAGLALPDSHTHSPNERMLLETFPLGVAAARETYRALGTLST